MPGPSPFPRCAILLAIPSLRRRPALAVACPGSTLVLFPIPTCPLPPYPTCASELLVSGARTPACRLPARAAVRDARHLDGRRARARQPLYVARATPPLRLRADLCPAQSVRVPAATFSLDAMRGTPEREWDNSSSREHAEVSIAPRLALRVPVTAPDGPDQRHGARRARDGRDRQPVHVVSVAPRDPRPQRQVRARKEKGATTPRVVFSLLLRTPSLKTCTCDRPVFLLSRFVVIPRPRLCTFPVSPRTSARILLCFHCPVLRAHPHILYPVSICCVPL